MTADDRRRWILGEIMADAKADVERFEGAPFTGRTVAEYMGCQAAAISALAEVMLTLLPEEPSGGDEAGACDLVACRVAAEAMMLSADPQEHGDTCPVWTRGAAVDGCVCAVRDRVWRNAKVVVRALSDRLMPEGVTGG